ncbi:MAG: DUF2058 family protein [Lysobacterales bacterium]|jgi:uncharacterized protein YaiL (DUF2058 family)
MGESLQEQLRALGLAREKEAKGKKPQSRRKPRSNRHQQGATGGGEIPLDKAWALRDRAEQKQADQARRRKQSEDRRRQQINGEIRKVVEAHRRNHEDAEIARNFMYKGRIRKIYVTPEQQAALSGGQLGIVYLTGGYHLLEPPALEEVRAISAEHVVDLDTGSEEDEDAPVPDDLTW